MYVREAHPGERFPQPDSLAQKLGHARVYQELNAFPWPVAVDSAGGDFHRALGPRPNATYLMDIGGNVAFRALASNDARVLHEGLQALVAGEPLPIGERKPLVIPMLKAMGVMRDVLALGGQVARQDFQRELPGVYPVLVLSALFRPFPPLARAVLALAMGVVALMAPVAWLAWILQGRR